MTEHEGVKIFFTFDYFLPFMIVMQEKLVIISSQQRDGKSGAG
jgi:hypothetical protein